MKPNRVGGIAVLTVLLFATPVMAGSDTGDDLGAFIRQGNCEKPGDVDSDGILLIDLDTVNHSGYSGRVHFGPSNDEDATTEVTTGVWKSDWGTPIASPGA